MARLLPTAPWPRRRSLVLAWWQQSSHRHDSIGTGECLRRLQAICRNLYPLDTVLPGPPLARGFREPAWVESRRCYGCAGSSL